MLLWSIARVARTYCSWISLELFEMIAISFLTIRLCTENGSSLEYERSMMFCCFALFWNASQRGENWMGLFRYHMWPFSAIRWQVQPATRRLHQKWSYRVVSHPDNLYASQKKNRSRDCWPGGANPRKRDECVEYSWRRPRTFFEQKDFLGAVWFWSLGSSTS